MNEGISPELLCMNCMSQETKEGICPVCGFDERNDQMSPHHLLLRTILNGKYLVGRVLGEGGFGITYLGWDLNLDLKIAIKEYYPTGFVTRENTSTNTVMPYAGEKTEFFQSGREKFVEEAKRLARFYTLPGIVSIKDFFLENSTAYIVMEYVEGETLKQYLARMGGKVPADMMLELMKPLMKSLIEIHRAGIIHRDISPDNIMITKEGNIKLIDFGAARDFANSGNKSLSVMLKPGYAPEEQYRTRGVQGPWTDIYALCATIYKAITGVTPDESIERTRLDELKKPSELGAAIRKSQETALLKGMEVLQEHRFQNVEELIHSVYDQESAIPSSQPLPQPSPQPMPQPKPPLSSAPYPQQIKQRAESSISPIFKDNFVDKVPYEAKKPEYIKVSKKFVGFAAVCVAIILLFAIRPFSRDNHVTPYISEPAVNDITEQPASQEITREPYLSDPTETPDSEETTQEPYLSDPAETPDSEKITQEPYLSDPVDTPDSEEISDPYLSDPVYGSDTITDASYDTGSQEDITNIKNVYNSHYVDTVTYTEDITQSCSLDPAQPVYEEMEVLSGSLTTVSEWDFYRIEIFEDNCELHVVLDPEYEFDFHDIRICIWDSDYNLLYDGKAYNPDTEFIQYNASSVLNKGDCYIGIYRVDNMSDWVINYQFYYFSY